MLRSFTTRRDIAQYADDIISASKCHGSDGHSRRVEIAVEEIRSRISYGEQYDDEGPELQAAWAAAEERMTSEHEPARIEYTGRYMIQDTTTGETYVVDFKSRTCCGPLECTDLEAPLDDYHCEDNADPAMLSLDGWRIVRDESTIDLTSQTIIDAVPSGIDSDVVLDLRSMTREQVIDKLEALLHVDLSSETCALARLVVRLTADLAHAEIGWVRMDDGPEPSLEWRGFWLRCADGTLERWVRIEQ